MKNSCCLPHGTLSLSLCFVSSVCLLLSIMSTLVCNFVNVELTRTMTRQEDWGEGPFNMTEGEWRIEQIALNEYCHEDQYRSWWSDYDYYMYEYISKDEDIWKTARGLASAAALLGFLGTAHAWILPCKKLPRPFFWGLALVYLICALLQGLALLVLTSDVCQASCMDLDGTSPPWDEMAMYGRTCSGDCKLGAGAGMSICASVLWVVSAILAVALGWLNTAANTKEDNAVQSEESQHAGLLGGGAEQAPLRSDQSDTADV